MSREPRTSQRCLCGCGRPVHRRCRYASIACIPHTQRQVWGAQGRKVARWSLWQRRFRDDIRRLTADGRNIRGEDLFDLLREVYLRGYRAGNCRDRRQTARARRVAA